MTTRIALTISTVIFVGIIGYAYMTLPYKGTTPATQTAQTTDTGSTNTDTTQPTTDTTSSTQSGTQSSGSTQSSGISMATIATHNSRSSCWTTISGKVYDLTDWIAQHPGGPAAILSLCGADGTAAFTAQHGGQSRPAAELATLYIGDLAH